MKNIFLCFFLLLSIKVISANTSIINELPGNQITLQFQLGNWQLKNIGGGKNQIEAKDLSASLKKGFPEVYFSSESVVLDANGHWALSIIDSSYTDYPQIDLIPSKGNIKRPISPATVPYVYGSVYQQNAFWPSTLASLGNPYIMRSTRGSAVQFNPFTYNAVTKILRVYHQVTIKIERVNSNGVNPLPAYLQQMPSGSEWKEIVNKQFINGKTRTRYSPLNDEGSMLIVCHNDVNFLSAMQPFVTWKTQRGMKVDMIDYSVVGSTPAGLKAYIQNNFPTEAWTFILLVGDAPQISPMYVTSGPSDNDYAYLTGGDSYPELIIGRFSAETATEVATMVEKSIWYERDITGSATWLSNTICIASDEGPGDDNQMDWEHSRELGTILNAATYTGINELFDGSHGGLDASGNPNNGSVSSILEGNGAGLMNYTGHGSNASIVTTGFSNSDVNNLDNAQKLPLFISVGCVNGEFQTGTCFAEHWLRARKNNAPTGAVGALMSTINQSWNPPMEGQDEMVNIIAETYPNNIKRTFGGIAVNGCMQMNDSYGAAGDEMTDTWILFGDPSLLIRTSTPQNMTVTHPAVVNLGISTLNVNCSYNGARITLVQNGNILASEICAAGMAQFNFTALSSLDSILVTAVGYNQVSYQGAILVISPNAAFVTVTSALVNDAVNGNNNQQADYNETVDLNVTLNNIGSVDANTVTAVITTNDPLITAIIIDSHNFGNIPTGGSMVGVAAFRIQIAPFVPDGHTANFTIVATDINGVSWSNTFDIQLHAPVLNTTGWLINDAGGNQNGRLDAGETVTISIVCENLGSSASTVSSIELTDNSNLITISNPIQTAGVLNGNTFTANFTIQVSPAAPTGSWVNFDWTLTAGAYQHSSSKPARIGLVVEDFETGDFSAFSWGASGNSPWITTTINPFEGLTCSQSGSIGDSQTSTLQIQLNVAQLDTVYFMHKESCEEGWDFLRFYVDGVKKGEWSGNTAWSQAKFAMGGGPRTLKWTYVKDSYMAEFSDCAWIDEVVFPMLVLDTNTTSAINNWSAKENWSIAPNPSSGLLMVSGTLSGDNQVKIELISSSGTLIRTLENNSFSAGNAQLGYDISDLSQGYYLVRITENSQVLNFKWIKTGK